MGSYESLPGRLTHHQLKFADIIIVLLLLGISCYILTVMVHIDGHAVKAAWWANGSAVDPIVRTSKHTKTASLLRRNAKKTKNLQAVICWLVNAISHYYNIKITSREKYYINFILPFCGIWCCKFVIITII